MNVEIVKGVEPKTLPQPIEVLKEEIDRLKKEYPFPEPYVVIKGLPVQQSMFFLTEALKEIVATEPSLLEERKTALRQQMEAALRKIPHGRTQSQPRGKREASDIRESYAGKMEKRLQAKDYPLVDMILRSPRSDPFEIQAKVSPLANGHSLPVGGERHPFYDYICERSPRSALELIMTADIEVLYKYFIIRKAAKRIVDAPQKEGFPKISENKAVDLVYIQVQAEELPISKEIQPKIGDISRTLHLAAGGDRRR